MAAEKEPTVRALQVRLTRERERRERTERAMDNLFTRFLDVLELYRQDMGFTDEYPPKERSR